MIPGFPRAIFRCPAALAAWALASLCGLAPAQSKIQSPESGICAPFLWKIEGARKPSWIFGTIHLARPEVATPPKAVVAALDAADAVYTEIPMDAATLLALAPQLLLPAGQSLADIVGRDLAAEGAAEFVRGNPKANSAASFQRLKPWAAAASLLENDGRPGVRPLDLVLFQRAALARKETGGLETPVEQLAIFDDLSAAEQAALLRETLAQIRESRARGQNLSDTLAALYLAGDLDVLVAELNKLDAAGRDPAFNRKLEERLLDHRNAVMAGRIVQKIRASPGKSFFFAVGAAHLPGDRGLLAALEKAGFRLTRGQKKD